MYKSSGHKTGKCKQERCFEGYDYTDAGALSWERPLSKMLREKNYFIPHVDDRNESAKAFQVPAGCV